MLGNLIRFVDGLFCDTILSTTTITTRRYYGESADFIRELYGQRKSDQPIVEDEICTGPEVEYFADHFLVNGQVINLPTFILSRPDVVVEGKVTHTSFPHYHQAPFSVSYVDLERSFASYDGTPLGRNQAGGHQSRSTVLNKHAKYGEYVDSDVFIQKTETRYEDFILTFAMSKEWTMITFIREDGSLVQISQNNINQFDSDTESLVLAFGYVRAFLLTLASVDKPFTGYEEEQLVSVVLSLFLTCKEQLQ